MGRSAVSQRFVTQSGHKLTQLLSRSLTDLELAVLMIDGVHFGQHVVLVAMGIDPGGHKLVLEVWEGATENAATCKALLASLSERGLRTERAILVVIDGSKALASAVRDVFGKRAIIQRCREHSVPYQARDDSSSAAPTPRSSTRLAPTRFQGAGPPPSPSMA